MADFSHTTQKTEQTVFTVHEWPDFDPNYTTVLIRLPGDYEVTMSAVDAQELGNAINGAGHGVRGGKSS